MPVYRDNNRNSWYFKCCINGRQFLRRGFTTKNEARKAEMLFMYENQNQRKKANKAVLTWERLVDYYLEWYKDQVKITRFYAVKRELKNSLFHYLPNIEVDRMIYADFKNARDKIEHLNVGIDTKNRKIRILKAVLSYGEIFHQIKCTDYKKISSFKNYTIQRKSIKTQIITFDEFKSLYEVCDDYYKLLFLTLYIFGLRIGELMGLKIDCFDFKENTMQIYQSISWKTGTGSFVKVTPKTLTSNRFFYMPEKYVALLKKHILKNKLQSDHYVFFSTQDKARPMSENTLRYHFTRFSKLANFNHGTHFHAFRHTNASELYDRGISEDDIKEYEGHSSVEITEKIYIHQTDARKKRTMEVVNSILKAL